MIEISTEVKEFIEDYIELIEEENWEKFFHNWYQESPDEYSLCMSPSYSDELLSVLEEAGFYNIKQSTSSVRETIITRHMDDIIQDIWGKYYSRVDTWELEYSDIVSKLYNSLGFSLEELYSILNKWDEAGLTPVPEKCVFEVEGL